MGNSSSRRRRRHHHHQQHPPGPIYPPLPPPPPGYHTEIAPCPHMVSPYYYRPPRPGSYFFQQQQGYYGTPAPPPPPPRLPAPPPQLFLPAPRTPLPWNGSTAIVPSSSAPAPAPVPVPEYQTANTVRNEVNLNKGTLRLERDVAMPGNHVVAFSFDATTSGSITVFFLSKETSNGSVASLSKMFPAPTRHHFKSGLGQKFKQEAGLDFSLIDEQDLSQLGTDNVYPLIIRIETTPKNPPPDAAESPEPVGGALKKWIHCQQTYAVIRKIERDGDEGELQVRVVKQIIWVDGVRYELQEIFGIGGSEASNNSSDSSGKECVICLSEPKDTTVLPCRHMCMCSDCANVLRHQTNLCPICRCPVEELLHIKV
ncbi:probable E3 ubiquitin-protein ligase LOG2 [Selaginella moellendorffii]|uniref:probable E3 ubiquitin-protein ligase LOG2 n=1 Tax=Selaginella moellendorffii TaxID=88036 RepID=UPI000D1C5842|nr:probable E3 ubiquitin-protein ligase LOG2 [Selaginella moellendorffii]|eukprot:XP_024537766.1 probable E3 ubiquitin-protein ligase LOG2 [Selaginella moellendorffii]